MGAPLPDLDLRDLGGQPADLAEYRGRVVVLNLWATWCLPCRDEMPELQELQERHEPLELTVVGISIDHDGAELVRAFLEEHGIGYPNLMAEGGPLVDALGLSPGVPYTLLVDRGGTVRGYWRGRFHPFEPATEGLIARVLAEPAPSD